MKITKSGLEFGKMLLNAAEIAVWRYFKRGDTDTESMLLLQDISGKLTLGKCNFLDQSKKARS